MERSIGRVNSAARLTGFARIIHNKQALKRKVELECMYMYGSIDCYLTEIVRPATVVKFT